MTRRFYDALSEALSASGWSIASLCEKAGVSKDQITKFMQRGAQGKQASTNVDDALKIAHALGFTLDEMLHDDTAAIRSEAVHLWQRLSQAERDILLAAARGQRDGKSEPHS